MILAELKRCIQRLEENGIKPNTNVVIAIPGDRNNGAVDLMGVQVEEITYSSSLECYKINDTGIPKPNGKEAIVLC